jgi:hypothetical protein
VKAFRPKRLIPTVNVTDTESFDRMIAKFADLMDLSESKKHIDRFFVAKAAKAEPVPCIDQDFLLSVKTPELGASSRKRSVQDLDEASAQQSLDECELVQQDSRCLKACRFKEEALCDDVLLCEDCSQTVAEDVCEIFDM